MPMLKELLTGRAGTSLLAATPLWELAVESITPTDLSTFVDGCAGPVRDAAESAVEIALAEVTRAVGRNELAVPQMLAYARHSTPALSEVELKNGLHHLGTLRAAALLFALECSMSAAAVSRLTWRQAGPLYHDLSVAARTCLYAAPPPHPTVQYVFWRQSRYGLALPLGDLEGDAMDAFGLDWTELARAYQNLAR